MCGINGIFVVDELTMEGVRIVDRMNAEMHYRGPDDSGIWKTANACLGMVRLSIIGLGNGHQPILNEDETIGLVCNGEIYNYEELRNELLELGHDFRTNTDVEVILHLYEEFGVSDFPSRLVGMFAFAIYDSKVPRLMLARDRMGEKPLYTNLSLGRFLFSSEIKAITHCSNQEFHLDEQVLEDAVEVSWPQSPRRTAVKGIERVLPGEMMCITKSSVERRQYWTPPQPQSQPTTEQECAGKVRELLEQAICRTLVAEVPVGLLLSGGMDSTAIATLASQQKQGISAITIGYKDESPFDERKIARQTAQKLGIHLEEVELTEQQFCDAFDEYICYLDEPIGDPAGILQWCIFKHARKLGYKVLLSGLGADELFLGYSQHNKNAESQRLASDYRELLPLDRKSLPRILYKTISSPASIWRAVRSYRPSGFICKRRECLDRVSFANSPASIYSRYTASARDPLEATYDYLRENYLPQNGFALTDKLSMAHSLEVRCPFADADLVDYVLSQSLSNRYSPHKSKQLLRQAVPELNRLIDLDSPKKGFTPSLGFLHQLLQRKSIYSGDLTKAVVTELRKSLIRS